MLPLANKPIAWKAARRTSPVPGLGQQQHRQQQAALSVRRKVLCRTFSEAPPANDTARPTTPQPGDDALPPADISSAAHSPEPSETTPEPSPPTPTPSPLPYEAAATTASPALSPPPPSPSPTTSPSPRTASAAPSDTVSSSDAAEHVGRELVSHPLLAEHAGGDGGGKGSAEEEEDDFFATKELAEELKSSASVGKRGEAWFLSAAAALVLIIFCPFKLQGLIDMFGAVACSAGAVFIAYALLSLGRNFSPLPTPRKKHQLVTGGMYAHLRHPQYAGLLAISLGVACLTRSETRLALTAVLWFVLNRMASLEEKQLQERYPASWPEYAGTVTKRFVPFFA